jgi:hypothetical protein
MPTRSPRWSGPDGVRAQWRPAGLRAEQRGPSVLGPDRPGGGQLGGRRRVTREAYTLRPDDGDFNQAGTLVREVWDDAARERFVETVAGHLLGGVKGDVLEKAFLYWHNVDAETGKKIEELVRAGLGEPNPGTETAQAKAEAK